MHFLRRIKAAQENGEALSAQNQAAELSSKNNQSYFQCAFRRLTVTHSIFTNVYLQVFIYFSVFWEDFCSFFAKQIGKFIGIFF
jgi:hypothetical protein